MFEVKWIVNDLAELGVEIHTDEGIKRFFLYKGESLEYTKDGDVENMRFRYVEKREFGECCHPVDIPKNGRWGQITESDLEEYNSRFDWLPMFPKADSFDPSI